MTLPAVLNPFVWLRAAAKAATLAGILDALEEVRPPTPPPVPLGERMAALGPAEEAATRGKR